MAKKTFYEVLQVSPYADTEIIKAAYNSLMQRFYPNGSPGDPNDDFLKALNKAYEVLSDPAKRAGYDAALADVDDGGGHQADAAHSTKKATTAPEANLHNIPAPSDESAQTSSGDNVDLYKAAIGEKNTSYYLAKFEQFDRQGSGLRAGWNWPAFFFAVPWALYRKMYGWCIALWLIGAFLNAIGKAGGDRVDMVLLVVAWLPMSAAFSVFANSLYYSNIKKKIAVAQLAVSDESKLLKHLRYKGGVHAWVIWFFVFVLIIGIVAAITIPAYHDYQKRAVAQQSQQPASGGYSPNDVPVGGASPQNKQAASDPLGLYGAPPGAASPQNKQAASDPLGLYGAPAPGAPPQKLPPSAVEKITASNGTLAGQGFEITLNNNNPDWTVTELQLMVFEMDGKAGTLIQASPHVGAVASVVVFKDVTIPYGKSRVSFNTDTNKAYGFTLLDDIKGFKP